MENLALNKKLTQKRQRELIDEIREELISTLTPVLEPSELEIAIPIINEIAFIRVTLHTLKYDMIKNGAVYEFVNGSQRMLIEHPSSKVYNSLIPKYNALFSSLFKLLPEKEAISGKANESEDKLKKFLSEYK